ncbi:response regulator transcription factor [Paenibacillus sp. IB182496]|uniref:Response regulator transcription factor n=1 Tax=Paenibacillus sabuli TaxID=2772509 RepID=A0A927GT31_9BACL|nr:response regulator transcription factor [Paenibacillus sabuli]MBD2847394.1 response regulator transcription factor [Paenibacillus sabuli]
MTMARRILLLDMASNAAQTIRYLAEECGWLVEEDRTRKGYLQKVAHGEYALVLLDVSDRSPERFAHCRAVKRALKERPLLLLTDTGEVEERLHGFQAGADDCLSKPYSPRELIYRMRVLLMRTNVSADRPHAPDADQPRHSALLGLKLRIERRGRTLWVDRHCVRLSRRECTLLCCLAERRNRTVSREELRRRVWNAETGPSDRIVDANIRRIREKLRRLSPDLGGLIRTARGQGYCLLDPAVVGG